MEPCDVFDTRDFDLFEILGYRSHVYICLLQEVFLVIKT